MVELLGNKHNGCCKMQAHARVCEENIELDKKQVNIVISKNQALQILYLKHYA